MGVGVRVVGDFERPALARRLFFPTNAVNLPLFSPARLTLDREEPERVVCGEERALGGWKR